MYDAIVSAPAAPGRRPDGQAARPLGSLGPAAGPGQLPQRHLFHPGYHGRVPRRRAALLDDRRRLRRPLAEALADYERQRNAAVMPMYELTCQLARLEPPSPEMQQLFGALRHNPKATDRFIGTVAGTVPIPAFFAPENLSRIIGEAPSAAA